MKRTVVRTSTVLGLAACLFSTGGLLAAGTAVAARQPTPPTAATPMGPYVKLPPQLFDQSAAPLHSPLLSDPLGRKFK